MSKCKLKKMPIHVVKGPRFKHVIKEAQQYVLQLAIKKLPKAEKNYAQEVIR
ncbi:hypothetical protein CLV97_1235 [Planifilum fimeticola]|jgi:hypothetical protein|uniref:Uncharacterized protein n=1 Tax=Planifilum fimeticola TaxID=201975 RepID=A0A2T0LC93_9BACL|nr:hypothetical protein [Planifilum fimeticola]PRX39552.1 hypothetical protein CLV97_1235 [Planifilum fimeticola]